MNHQDHVALLRAGILAEGGIWADLGSGTGAFTLALAELVGTSATLYSIDRDGAALREQQESMKTRFPAVTVDYQQADFATPLALPPLDGIVMANSLHFIRQKDPILQWIYTTLKPDGRLLIVEYNTDQGNQWVPYPFSFPSWQTLANRAGFRETHLLATRPSRFLGEIYSAVSLK